MDIELPEPPPMQASPEDIPLDVRACPPSPTPPPPLRPRPRPRRARLAPAGSPRPGGISDASRERRAPCACAAPQVVYEDAHVLVVNKPAGLVVHPSAGHEARLSRSGASGFPAPPPGLLCVGGGRAASRG